MKELKYFLKRTLQQTQVICNLKVQKSPQIYETSIWAVSGNVVQEHHIVLSV